jgi:hypothetical protein
MSTRSGIGIEKEDGTVVGVYCHSDGYPTGVGMILQEHYREPTKLSSLVALGDISSLDQDIGEKHPFSDRPKGSSTFYGRDRGDTGTAPRTFATREEFRTGLRSAGVEFFYLAKTVDSAAEFAYRTTFENSGFETQWGASKPWGRWRSLELVLEQGVDVLFEHHPDEGPDLVVDHRGVRPGMVVLRAGSSVGRRWLAQHVDTDFGSGVEEARIDGLGITRDDLRPLLERADRDGLVVDQDTPRAPLSPEAETADIVVERHVLYGSPVLAVRFQTPGALDWAQRNRHPDVQGGDDGLWACHPQALPKIVGARREGLVVVVEGEDR